MKKKKEKIINKKDSKKKAKIELIIYLSFFAFVVLFLKVSSIINKKDEPIKDNVFLDKITDNFEYNIDININNDLISYFGSKLGKNMTVNFKDKEEITKYICRNNKCYEKENDNYILTSNDKIFSYIKYNYLDINTLKEYLNLSVKENNTYYLKVSDILLNSSNNNFITININNGDNNITIDYTNLFKEIDKTKEKVFVSITYSNIDKIINLDE